MIAYASLLLTLIVHLAIFQRRPITDPIHAACLAFCYYNLFTPVAMEIYGDYGIIAVDKMEWITQETIDSTAWHAVFGYTALALGYRTVLNFVDSPVSPKIFLDSRTLITSTTSVRMLIACAFLFAVTVTFFGSQMTLAMQSYEGKVQINYENSGYSWLLNFVEVLLAVWFVWLILSSKNYLTFALSGIVLFLGISFATFSKGPFLFDSAFAFAVLSRHKFIKPLVAIPVLSVTLIGFLTFIVPVFAAYRATGDVDFFSNNHLTVSMLMSDAVSPYWVNALAEQNGVSVADNPLWQSFVLWIPKFIWSTRPLDLSEGFARQIMTNWQPGYGLAFSVLAEGIMRFGVLGMPLFMFGVGAIYSAFNQSFLRLVPVDLRQAAFLVVGSQLAALIFRGPFSGLITNSIHEWIPLVITLATIGGGKNIAKSIMRRPQYYDAQGAYLSNRPGPTQRLQALDTDRPKASKRHH